MALIREQMKAVETAAIRAELKKAGERLAKLCPHGNELNLKIDVAVMVAMADSVQAYKIGTVSTEQSDAIIDLATDRVKFLFAECLECILMGGDKES